MQNYNLFYISNCLAIFENLPITFCSYKKLATSKHKTVCHY